PPAARATRARPRARARHALRECDVAHPQLRYRLVEPRLLRGCAGNRRARLRIDRRGGQVPAARRGDRVTTLAAVLVLAGALLAFLGSLGLLRMKTFFERVHPPTMGTTLGTGLVLIGSMVFFTVHESRPVLHEIL